MSPESNPSDPQPEEAVETTSPEVPPAGVVTDARPEELDGKVEALLFSSEVPLPAKRIAELAVSRSPRVLEAIDRLNVFYGESSRAFRIVPIAGGFQLVTTPDFGGLLAKLHRDRVPTRLSRAALETLSIIAFKQPVTRAEIDTIRGVSASDGVLRHLLDRKLVRIAGRAEAPGRPLLYATTREFLTYFGLSSLSDLPRTDELSSLLAGDIPSEAEEPVEEAPSSEATPGIMEEPAEPFEDPEMPEPEHEVESDLEELGESAAPESDPGEEESRRTSLSHSGEESDDHGGVPTP
jgi:segregation and condensation protein B